MKYEGKKNNERLTTIDVQPPKNQALDKQKSLDAAAMLKCSVNLYCTIGGLLIQCNKNV